MSGESGGGSIQNTVRRVVASKGIVGEQIPNFVFSRDIPKIGQHTHHERLRRFIERDALEVLFIDPAYLALAEAAGDASNVFAMGGLLLNLTEIGRTTGCTICLIHHNSKGASNANKFGQPSLSDMSQSGFAEWARQWILLGPRRNWDDTTGEHWLHMITGGSAGHADSWAVDVVEGHHEDPGGRRWDVAVSRARDAEEATQKAHERAKEDVAAEAVERDRQSIVKALRRVEGHQETKTEIRESAGLNTNSLAIALNSLIDDGTVEACKITKGNNHRYAAFRLKDDQE